MTFILISDLDGFLFGQHSFDFGLIKSEIVSLLGSGHLLVLASGKTKAEIESFVMNLVAVNRLFLKTAQVSRILA